MGNRPLKKYTLLNFIQILAVSVAVTKEELALRLTSINAEGHKSDIKHKSRPLLTDGLQMQHYQRLQND